MLPMVFKNHGSAVHNGQDCSSGYEFSENLLKNIAIQVKSSNFRKGKDWKAVMGGLPILISIDDEVFLRGVLSGEEKLNKDDVVIDFSQVCERSSQWCELRYSQVQTAH